MNINPVGNTGTDTAGAQDAAAQQADMNQQSEAATLAAKKEQTRHDTVMAFLNSIR
jgi:hypothetical protein